MTDTVDIKEFSEIKKEAEATPTDIIYDPSGSEVYIKAEPQASTHQNPEPDFIYEPSGSEVYIKAEPEALTHQNPGTDKRERATNFSRFETSLLVKLSNEQAHILENKKTDHLTNARKKKCWEKIAEIFNSANIGPTRCAKVLKSKYDSIKKELRKQRANSSWRITRGAPNEPSPPPILLPLPPEEEEILAEKISHCREGIKPVPHADSGSTPPCCATPPDEYMTESDPSSSGEIETAPRDDIRTSHKKHRVVAGRSERRRPNIPRRHTYSSASAKFQSLANAKLRLARKKELLIDLQIQAMRKQRLYYELKIADMQKK